MHKIRSAFIHDAFHLAALGRTTFYEGHSSSASASEMESFLNMKFDLENVKNELADIKNHYYLISWNEKLVGYSKIILNQSNPCVANEPIAKLERLYILAEYYDKKLGWELLSHAIDFAKMNNQKGLWLMVWEKNERAIRFYKKATFAKVGETEFRFSPTHANPNYWMYLEF
ncbi:MAG: GNAT family N-acetyltransferase [Flavobacteriales bacterium]|nr:GNAT family N-acetyltransferase [Flavobacteriales bacterium]